ncbi:MAG: phosphoribosyltransferase family protein [Candidatus Nanoperiomorbaceae bacterium]
MSQYFDSRAVAGAQITGELLSTYFRQDVTVLALDDGGVAVGYQIAIYLHANLRRLITESIRIEDEDVDFATVLPGGVVARNPDMDDETYEYYYGEYAGDLDERLREARDRINAKLDADEISPDDLRGRNVILVSDGLKSGTILHAAIEWLKPAMVQRIILATPLISVDALDVAHVLMDEIHVLAVSPNYLWTAHYYDVDDTPSEDEIRAMMSQTVMDRQ